MFRIHLAAVAALTLAQAALSQPVAQEIPPHDLDSAFERATTIKTMDEGLLNNQLFKSAVQAALKAKQDREAALRQQPEMPGPSPDRAARIKFLETLNPVRAAGAAVGQVPPHPLDGAFAKATNTNGIDVGLLNNAKFQQAVRDALAAKQNREAAQRQNPIGPSPFRAARVKFLEVIEGN